MRTLVQILLLLGIAGCGLSKDNAVPAKRLNLAAIAVFSKQVHPILTAQCSQCHLGGGAPGLANKDVAKAYPEALRYLTDPVDKSSLFVRRITPHQGCMTCTGTGNDILPGLKAWYEEVKKGGADEGSDAGLIKTQAVSLSTVPETANLNGAGVAITLDLGTASPSIRGGAGMSLIFSAYKVQGSYYFLNPRVRNGTNTAAALSFKGIYPTLSGTTLQTSNLPTDVLGNAAQDGVQISAGQTVTLYTNGVVRPATSNAVYVAFRAISFGPVVNCKDVTTFTNTVYTYLNTNCVRCHGTNAGASSALLLDGATTSCPRILSRSDVQNPDNSAWVQYIQGNVHPVTFTNVPTTAISNWLALER